MFLFILESIGTAELILIGIIALIFLGPRKLPQIAKKMGKTMADFRNTTNEFKSTWQREVDFEEETNAFRMGELPESKNATVPRIDARQESTQTIAPPAIRPMQSDLFAEVAADAEPASKEESAPDDELSDKRNWL